jgi:hypothetical protein
LAPSDEKFEHPTITNPSKNMGVPTNATSVKTIFLARQQSLLLLTIIVRKDYKYYTLFLNFSMLILINL